MTDKLLNYQWCDLEDGGSKYYRLKNGLDIVQLLTDTMRENERLRDVLEQYSNENNWGSSICGEINNNEGCVWNAGYLGKDIDCDFGYSLAQQALQNKKSDNV